MCPLCLLWLKLSCAFLSLRLCLFVASFNLSVFMAISFLALDLDGTLLDSRGEISERNRLAIDNAREHAVHVALVTGRRFRDSRPVALELGLDNAREHAVHVA